MKILEIKNHEVTFISKDKEFEHLLQREPYKWLSNSYYFRNQVDNEK